MKIAPACLTIALMTTQLASPSVMAESIYRCDAADGSVLFSDQPCNESQQRYEPGQRLSIVSAAPNLSARISRNQAFIAQRRNQTRGRKSLPPEHQKPPGATKTAHPDQRLILFPVWQAPSPSPPDPGDPGSTESSGTQQRFSALSGPFPGTVRRASDQ